MHNRYTCPDMAKIWSDYNKYLTWFNIEFQVLCIHGDMGTVPVSAADKMLAHKIQCLDDIAEHVEDIEKETKHDVIAFLTRLSDVIGPDSKYIHYGMTSQDLIDTAQSLMIRQSLLLIEDRIKTILYALAEKALKHKMSFCAGRSHGIHAEPMTFGLKLLTHYAGFKRSLAALVRDRNEMIRIKCSGAVGTYSMIHPDVQERLAEYFNMKSEDIATQVIPRERLALLMSHLSILAGSIERFAVEIRHLQRTEVGEVAEGFSPGQKGSSAMPHKKNPILTENLTGLARVIRMGLIPAMENIALWHERDISHSSVERITLPDTFVHLSFALDRTASVINNMVVDEERMLHNLEATNGGIFSQQILLYLIGDKGYTREEAYKIVQDAAFTGDLAKGIASFLNQDDVSAIVDSNHYVKHIDHIYNTILEGQWRTSEN